MSVVTLTLTADGDATVTLSRKAAEMSKFLKNMLEEEAGASETSIPVANVKKEAMEAAARWMEHYKDGDKAFSELKKPLPGPDLETAGFNAFDRSLVTPWSLEFAKEVLTAANFLDVEQLLELAAARVATIIKGTPIAKLMEMVGVKEFTPEWEEEVRRKNPWCKAIQKQ